MVDKSFLLDRYKPFINPEVAPYQAQLNDMPYRAPHGLVIYPLNPHDFAYSDREIDYWVSKNDPAAQYIKAYRIYVDEGCKGYSKIRNLLTQAYNFDYDGPDKARKKYFPEAMGVLGNIRADCEKNFSNYQHYVDLAESGGFEYKSTPGLKQ